MTTIPAIVAVAVTQTNLDERYCNATATLADGTLIGIGAFLTLDTDLDGAGGLSAAEHDACRRSGYVIREYRGWDETWITLADGVEYDERDLMVAMIEGDLVWQCDEPDYEEIFETAVREKLAAAVAEIDLAHAGDAIAAICR